MDTLTLHAINKFMTMFIPLVFLENLPHIVTALLVTLIPYTPIGALAFTTIFMVVYFMNIFGLANKNTYSCKFNKLETETQKDLVSALKSTYYIYFVVMLFVNYFNIQTRMSLPGAASVVVPGAGIAAGVAGLARTGSGAGAASALMRPALGPALGSTLRPSPSPSPPTSPVSSTQSQYSTTMPKTVPQALPQTMPQALPQTVPKMMGPSAKPAVPNSFGPAAANFGSARPPMGRARL